MTVCLVDTGPLVALLDASEPAHAKMRDFMIGCGARLVTTGAVITEAFYFLSRVSGGPVNLASFIESSALETRDLFYPQALKAAVDLMWKYADTPMDFADATLVVLAERLSCPDILTLDERGFRTFRYGRSRSFHLVLQD